MSKGLINANILEVKALAVDWLKCRDLKISEGPLSPGSGSTKGDSGIKGVGLFYLATVWFRSEDGGCAADIRVRPRAYWNAILHGVLFIILGWGLVLIHQLLSEWTISKVSLLFLCWVLITSLIFWQNNWLSGKLARIELSFWDSVKSKFDFHRQTRAAGQVYRRRSRLIIELVFTGYLVVIGGMFLGFWGVVLILVLGVPILVMIVTDISKGDDPTWHWRLWIMGNMGRWTFLMLFVLGVVPILVALETFMPLEMYKAPDSLSPRQAIAKAQFREIRPATAKQLEADINGLLWEMSTPRSPEGDPDRHRFYFLGNSVMILLVTIVSIVCFVLIPFRGLLRSQGRWATEVGEKDASDGPYVPYLPKAREWEISWLLRSVIVFHAVFGGLIHIATTAFCLEGFSYAFLGKTVLWSQTANLWSWVFAVSKILFGDPFGWRVGLFLAAAISCPVLMMLGALARRMLSNVLLTIRICIRKKDRPQCFEQIECFMDRVCSREHIRKPVLWLTSCDDVEIRLRGILLSRAEVIEISRGAVELLDEAELQQVVAHELGHLSQGIRKISILKFLSSIALFPNHYLTLCLNWPASEIKADHFAQVATGNPEALQRAIVKISTAQMNCLQPRISRRAKYKANKNGIEWGVLRRIYEVLRIEYASIRFFFGDCLFGYSHPYVSERLEAIDLSHREAANESE